MYLKTLVNKKQNNWAKLLPIAKFAYNNTKNASINHTPLELNWEFYSQVLFEGDINSRSRSCLANKLADKLKKLMEICC